MPDLPLPKPPTPKASTSIPMPTAAVPPRISSPALARPNTPLPPAPTPVTPVISKPVIPAPVPAPSAESKQAQLASAGSPLKKFLPLILAGVGVLILLVVAALFFFNRQPKTTSVKTSSTASNRQTVPAEKMTLTYWGLWETSEVWESIFKEFESQHPGVDVVYQKQSHLDYRSRLQSAVVGGNGPDLFRFHASWTPMLSKELSPMPNSVMSASTFAQTFYPVATSQLTSAGQIMGIPLMYDGLALFYNKDALKAASAEAPKTWAELKILASKLTIRDSQNNITRAGLAIGNANNIDNFSDILGLLMLQNGADFSKPSSKEAQEALLFYTNFAKVDKVWDEKLPNASVAFARGDVAMIFAPSWKAHEIKAMNPQLNFAVASTPGLGDKKLAWASYWAEGVSAQSKNKTMAWELLKYLSSKEVMQKAYSAQAQNRSFGEIYSRVDLANTLASDLVVSPFLADAPYASSWYLNSLTHDAGLNDNLIKYYKDAINAVLGGKSVEEAMKTAELGTTQVLRQYAVTSAVK